MEEKIELEVAGLTLLEHAQPSYVLVLKEKDGDIRIPIVIGMFEAQAILIVKENLKPLRPLTHDLTVNILSQFGISIIEVYIKKIENDIFYSEIILEKDGKIISVDSRTSDAIALAMRFKCPIYTNRNVIANIGIDLKKIKNQMEQKEETSAEESKFADYTDDELENMLKKAVEQENYELASEIRDELKKRKKKD